ncbi:hypothetical protein QE152_g40186 [Popillia japonica]|uniref:Uncharacterized protein n=1 Tax=Popillia japonica TaxID=7064 RepID=A0AAW1HS95_POPJA
MPIITLLYQKRALTDAEVEQEALDAYLSDYSDSVSIASSHNTNTEMETDDSDDDVDNNDSEDNSHGVSEENEPPRLRKYFYKKNKYKWAKEPPVTRRARAKNIIRVHIPAVIGEARQMDIKDTTTAFKLIFDDTMLDILIRHTNEIITEMASKRTTTFSSTSSTFVVCNSCYDVIFAVIPQIVRYCVTCAFDEMDGRPGPLEGIP